MPKNVECSDTTFNVHSHGFILICASLSWNEFITIMTIIQSWEQMTFYYAPSLKSEGPRRCPGGAMRGVTTCTLCVYLPGKFMH